MSDMKQINWEKLCKLALALGERGIYITRADGHYWIDYDPCAEWSPIAELEDKGICLNNKIYGGFIEAILTATSALKRIGLDLEKVDFDAFDFDISEANESNIQQVDKGQGGIS